MRMSPQKIMPVAALLACLLLLGCSKSDDQKKFEQQAYSIPENYTAMNANGRPAGSGQTDPDDWRISPAYQGLIEVSTPAYPNPVSLNSSLRIDIDILGFESVPGLEVYTLRQVNNLFGPIVQLDQSELSPGLRVLVMDPSSFSGASSSQNATGLNRIIIFDGRDNVITYGDVRVN